VQGILSILLPALITDEATADEIDLNRLEQSSEASSVVEVVRRNRDVLFFLNLVLLCVPAKPLS
jgi:hypothetical protein